MIFHSKFNDSNGEPEFFVVCVTRVFLFISFPLIFFSFHSDSDYICMCVCVCEDVIFGTQKIFNLLQSAKSNFYFCTIFWLSFSLYFYGNVFVAAITTTLSTGNGCCFSAVNIQFSLAICCAAMANYQGTHQIQAQHS